MTIYCETAAGSLGSPIFRLAFCLAERNEEVQLSIPIFSAIRCS